MIVFLIEYKEAGPTARLLCLYADEVIDLPAV
ncbi:MAG: hypothetical protein RL151_1008 [Bacteroidota bacterium]